MPRFFYKEPIVSDSVRITGDDAHHISRSLRMAVGEQITVCDSLGVECLCELERIRDDEVTARVLSQKPSDREPPRRLVLYQSLAKGEKMDYIVQKAVETGVCRIVPVLSSRCIAKLEERNASAKLARWKKIAAEAAKQCGRGAVPEIGEPLSFDCALRQSCAESALTLFCYEGDGVRSLREILEHDTTRPGDTVSIFIGPEGGYSEEEFSASRAAGAVPTGLGKRILRCETASGFALACFCYRYEL